MRLIKNILPNIKKHIQTSQYNQQPETKLLAGVRTRLTFWYTAVLAIALLLFGVSLYFIVSNNLYAPVQNQLAAQATSLAYNWQTSPAATCPTQENSSSNQSDNNDKHDSADNNKKPPLILYIACYSASGTLLGSGDSFGQTSSQLPASFLNDDLAQQILSAGVNSSGNNTATDLINDDTVGQLYRYAIVVPIGNNQVEVLQIARPVTDIQSALDLLRNISLLLGILTLLGAGIGGLFLSNRALIPTRQAFARQQIFIADASHELRTPLTILRTEAELLLRSSGSRLTSEDAELAEDIVAESERLSNLANSLLELARLDAGQLQLEQEVTSLGELASATVQRLARVASEKGVRLAVSQLDKTLVTVDIQLMEECLLSLTDNAVKYTPSGGSVIVAASLVNNQPQIKISDTGIGIASEHLPRLGQRFYRVDKARSREAGGVGLGLSLAYNIVNLHSGSLEFESKPNVGTTVTLTLPASRVVENQFKKRNHLLLTGNSLH